MMLCSSEMLHRFFSIFPALELVSLCKHHQRILALVVFFVKVTVHTHGTFARVFTFLLPGVCETDPGSFFPAAGSEVLLKLR